MNKQQVARKIEISLSACSVLSLFDSDGQKIRSVSQVGALLSDVTPMCRKASGSVVVYGLSPRYYERPYLVFM